MYVCRVSFTGAWATYCVSHSLKKLTLPSWKPSATNSSSVKCGTSWVPIPSILKFIGFILSRSCSGNTAALSSWVQWLSFPEDLIFQRISPTSGSYMFLPPPLWCLLSLGQSVRGLFKWQTLFASAPINGEYLPSPKVLYRVFIWKTLPCLPRMHILLPQRPPPVEPQSGQVSSVLPYQVLNTPWTLFTSGAQEE